VAAKLVDEYQPFVVVVGLPLNMDGSISPMATRARVFSEKLARHTEAEIVLHDERLTSATAKADFKDAKAIGKASTEHELAACLILESWLNEHYMA
jgi:putative Holliday junction resolvase